MTVFRFPEDFIYGTASSAFQIEGSPYADGKGETIWDYMCRVYPESFHNGAKIEPGSWFYKNYEQDIADMKALGLKSFRLSISWARIQPEGTGAINQKGIDFYNRVIDLLLENGIEPFVDLFHWDLPMGLANQGGIKARSFIDAYVAYAKICFENFGDRVKYWSTFNEPGVFCFQLHSNGEKGWYPFGDSKADGYRAAHHVLISHFRTIKLYKQMGLKGKIGSVVDMAAIYPFDPAGNDVLAAQYQAERMGGWWMDPMFFGKYPEKLLQDCPELKAMIPDEYIEELQREFVPMDMLGVNYYYPAIIKYQENSMYKSSHAPSYYVQEGERFNQYPAGLYDLMMYLTKKYNCPEIYITENGLGKITSGDRETDVTDDERIRYLREHLRMVVRSINAGANIKGYYYWSHFDSLESRSGYQWRFGLVHVDTETGERTKKKSWYYYQKMIRDQAVD